MIEVYGVGPQEIPQHGVVLKEYIRTGPNFEEGVEVAKRCLQELGYTILRVVYGPSRQYCALIAKKEVSE